MRITFLYLAVWLFLSPSVQASAGWQFGPRTEVPNVNIATHNISPALSADELTLLFTNFVGPGNHDIMITTRETVDDQWGGPESLYGEVNSQYFEEGPFLSADGLSLYFTDGLWFAGLSAYRPGSRYGDLWVSRRESLDEDFGPPENLGDTVNSGRYDGQPKLSSDELTLVFDSQRPGGSGSTDLWTTRRADHQSPWQEPENLGPIINRGSHDAQPALSPDGLSLFFSSNRPGGIGGYDIWVTSRESIDGQWGEPAPLDENINSPFNEGVPFLSADGSALYFAASDGLSLGEGPYNIFQAARLVPEIPGDFDGDGVLSAADIDLVKPGSPDLQFDLDNNRLVDLEDRQVRVKDLKNTWIGDANLDGQFNSIDLITVLQAAKYELDVDASWAEGDWSGDLRFDHTDLIAALQDGGYALGPRAALSAVPEPSCAILLGIGIIGLCRLRRVR